MFLNLSISWIPTEGAISIAIEHFSQTLYRAHSPEIHMKQISAVIQS